MRFIHGTNGEEKDCDLMILDLVKKCLDRKGFRSVEVNVKGIYLHYVVLQQEIYIVVILDTPTGTEYTQEQYMHIRNQITDKFINQSKGAIRLLSIICTKNVNGVRKLYEGEIEQWLIDTSANRLILFEDQKGDFLDLKEEIENILLDARTKELDLEPEHTESPNYANVPTKKKFFGVSYFTKYNTFIIILNVLVFFIVNTMGSTRNSSYLLERGALYWPAVKQLHQFYRLITYMFLHSGFEHLANNMIILLVIGDNLERATGKWRFLVIYFVSGVIAGIASLSYNMLKGANAVSVGASGAIFGVVGAMAYIVIINKGHLENISSRQMVMFVLFSLYGGLTSQGIDNAAHIGGLLAGAVLAAILYRKPKKEQQEGG